MKTENVTKSQQLDQMDFNAVRKFASRGRDQRAPKQQCISCFSLAVYDVFTINPLDVGCVGIDSLV